MMQFLLSVLVGVVGIAGFVILAYTSGFWVNYFLATPSKRVRMLKHRPRLYGYYVGEGVMFMVLLFVFLAGTSAFGWLIRRVLGV